MRDNLLYILIFISYSCFGQEILPEWQWQNGRKTDFSSVRGFSAGLQFENIYGTDKLTAVSVKLRYCDPDINTIAAAGIEMLPSSDFNFSTFFIHYTYVANPVWSISNAYLRQKLKFRENGNSMISHRTGLTGTITKPPLYFSATLQYQIDETYQGRSGLWWVSANLLYSINKSIILSAEIRTPDPRIEPMVSLELNHQAGQKWGYGIGIGLPSPYFGFRLFLQLYKELALEVKSRRHPFLGFSHSAGILYNTI